MSFPLDDVTLALIEHSLDAVYIIDNNGDPINVGSDMSLSKLLEFLSGPSDEIFEGVVGETEIVYLTTPQYSVDDVIRAMITEIQNLRQKKD